MCPKSVPYYLFQSIILNPIKFLNSKGVPCLVAKSSEVKEEFEEIPQQIKSKQVVGNVGLFYVCYELCKRGWNAMPTSRNARGIDIVIYSQDGERKHTIQAKSLTKRDPVPLGPHLKNLMGDYLIICRNVFKEPEIFIASIDEIRERIHRGQNAKQQISHWLQPKQYEEFKENWDVIGRGDRVSNKER